MKKRLDNIKLTIDSHLELMMSGPYFKPTATSVMAFSAGDDPQKEPNPMIYNGFDLKKLSYTSKIKTLQLNEPYLAQAKKATKENLPILRMKGITQSYYMYDSILYKNSKKALEQLQK